MTRGRAAFLAVSLGLAARAGRVAHAQPARAEASAAPSAWLVLRAPADEEQALFEGILEAARGRQLAVVREGSPSSVLRVEVDVTATGAVVVVVDLRDDALLARRHVPRAGSSEVLREEVALVVGSVLDAARARTPAPRPSPAPPPAASPDAAPAQTKWEGVLFAEARAQGGGATLGPGLGVGARVSRERLSASLLGAWRSATEVDGSRADVRATGGIVRLLAGATLADGKRASLTARVGPGVAVERVSARPRAPDVDARAATTQTSPLATGLLELSWKLGAAGALELAAGAESPLTPRRYVVTTSEGVKPAWSPSRVQPLVLLSWVVPIGGGR